jgi:hypothetical protein
MNSIFCVEIKLDTYISANAFYIRLFMRQYTYTFIEIIIRSVVCINLLGILRHFLKIYIRFRFYQFSFIIKFIRL